MHQGLGLLSPNNEKDEKRAAIFVRFWLLVILVN